MKATRRFVLVFVALSLCFGVVALATAIGPRGTGGGNCIPHPGKGPRHQCQPKCPPCQQIVCDGTGRCKYHCEEIPGCTP